MVSSYGNALDNEQNGLGKQVTLIIRASLSLLAIWTFATAAAFAAMPPHVAKKLQDAADYHIQVELAAVTIPVKSPGNCIIEGNIIQIFRDRKGRLAKSDKLGFPIPCLRIKDPIDRGGLLRLYVENLIEARYIEVYLNDQNGKLIPATSQYRVIESGSEKSQLQIKRRRNRGLDLRGK